ncbi:hypothetical protein [Tropicimonas sediminicola]|uniref:Uncharacterized protein n=1 Tax=Tropicimonas sediminicola TaxID=1031541 RepID=A0A239DIF8_9RHOB|nr:hypothetical protein [Tropicimonas sediminicola]SNS32220.1 hypothetical protein SAMN05421757_101850 [Tropicimonas sediminicola]
MTDKIEETSKESATNATREDLEKLNGLLIRALIKKIEDGDATATDIGNAVKVVVSNKVRPEEPEGPNAFRNYFPDDQLDWPVNVGN